MLLADWMALNGITQLKLSVMSGVGQGYISDYLSGNKGIGKYSADKIIDAACGKDAEGKPFRGRVTLEELLFPEKYQEGAA